MHAGVRDNAVYFKKSNVKDLKNKLEFLLGSRDAVENYKQRAAQYVLSRYSWENAGKKTLALYRGEPLEDTDRK